jgi:glyoxylase-like metal-dependent hydrolase (beta-lactamase superfamily II)
MPQHGTIRWTIGAMEVTRVGDPDFELVLDQDAATAAILEATPWLFPDFVTDEQALRIGSSAIVVRTPSATILVDPFLAFDDPARLAPRMAALRAAGIDQEDVDLVICSHIDGIGACVAADGSPAFSRARYLVPAAELEDARAGVHGEPAQALVALEDKDVVEAVYGIETVVPGVHLEDAPGHNRGHVVVWLDSGGSHAVIAGHLLLHPAQMANPDIDNGDLDPIVLADTRRRLLARCVKEDALLVAPLFAPPGGGKVRADGDAWRLEPA